MSDSTNKVMYAITDPDLNTMSPQQWGIESIPDATTGFKMFGYKALDGVLQKVLCKGQPIVTPTIMHGASSNIISVDGTMSVNSLTTGSVVATNGVLSIGVEPGNTTILDEATFPTPFPGETPLLLWQSANEALFVGVEGAGKWVQIGSGSTQGIQGIQGIPGNDPDMTDYVPYINAIKTVNLGQHSLITPLVQAVTAETALTYSEIRLDVSETSDSTTSSATLAVYSEDGLYDGIQLGVSNVEGGTRDISLTVKNKHSEVFSQFNAYNKSLRVGPEGISRGVLHIVSDPTVADNNKIVTNVGATLADSGTFVRFGRGYTRQDCGTLTDDGLLKIIDNVGLVGTGYAWGSTALGYADHVNSINFAFDSSVVTVINAVGATDTTDTNAKLCVYLIDNALYLKNRLGYTANIGYKVDYFDNQAIYIPPTSMDWAATGVKGDWRTVSMSHDGVDIAAFPFYGLGKDSTNSGSTWATVTDFGGAKYCTASAMSSDGVIRLAGGAASNDPKPLYLSIDSGVTYTDLSLASGGLTDVTFDADSRTIYRASGSWLTDGFTAGMQIYVSGSHHNENNTAFKLLSVSESLITLVEGSILVTVATPGDTIRVIAMDERWLSAGVCDLGTKMIACAMGGSRGVLSISVDTGAHWTTKSYGDFRGCCISGQGAIMYACTYSGYVFKSVDSGTTFTLVSIPKRSYVSIACSEEGDILLLGTSSSYFYVSTNSGGTWAEVTSMGGGQWRSCAMSTNGSIMIIADHNGGKVAMSYDTGSVWALQTIPAELWYGVDINGTGTQAVLVSEDPNRNIYLGTSA